MSALTQMFSFFGRVPGDELCLVTGECPYIVDDGVKTMLGNQPMSPGLVFSAATELLSVDELRSLPAHRPRVVRHEHDGALWLVEVSRVKGGIGISIRRLEAPRASKGPAAPARASLAPDHMRHPSFGAPANDQSPEGQDGLDFDDDTALPADPPPAPTSGPCSVTSAPTRGVGTLLDVLEAAADAGASDIHLSSDRAAFVRVNGELVPAASRNIPEVDDLVRDLADLMPPNAAMRLAAHKETQFVTTIRGVARFRVKPFVDVGGMGAAVRVVPEAIPTAESLSLPRACVELCHLPAGLVIVTGPTGSGRTSTLAAMVDHINRDRSEHIVTIEESVEVVHAPIKSLVRHREVGNAPRASLNALRAAVREDPDVIVIGELRDPATMAFALELAEAGHLVLAAMHTLTAVSAIERLIDAFPGDKQAQARLLVSRAVRGVVAQTLCRRVNGGRVAAYEVLVGTPAVAALVREGKAYQATEVMQVSKGLGMTTLNESLLSLVQRKIVTPREAMAQAVDKLGLAATLNQLARASSNPRLKRVRSEPKLEVVGPTRVSR